ncbi:heat shock protein DnaJ domain-containing protein [Gordonia terrae C-6]|uniref:Heat shock protein DnaJ domain-containing protein n=2 Tax=Gordonia terrae TaxID=2055 RepID=R7YCR8_9ACTN|nr:heat shock protein DnaJ domain-containing protein [Gordonia terrae C-6]
MRTELLRQLRLLKATDVVISSNLRLRQDGFPYSGQRQPEDTGIAVYFKLNGEDQCIPCDKWTTVEHNLRAIILTIEALRGLDRWGAKEMVHAAFRGFKALPAEAIVTPFTAKPWHEVLEVSPTASPETIKAAYRAQLKKHHPDHGGREADLIAVQRAYEQATGGGS